MRIDEWLLTASNELKATNIPTARLDCLILIEDTINKDRAWLLSHPEHKLQGSDLKILSTKIAQRAQHIPLAYIRGKSEFYGREFIVNQHTLVPRPETEAIIEMLKRVRNREADMHVFPGEPYKRRVKEKKRYPFQKVETNTSLVKTNNGYKLVWQKPPRAETIIPTSGEQSRNALSYHDEDLYIADIGTGSGALAVTAKFEIPDAQVVACDIDKQCIQVASSNAAKHKVAIKMYQGNLFDALHGVLPGDRCLILLCNLPYVPNDYPINEAAKHEPRLALFAGSDGLDLYHHMFDQINVSHIKPAYIITESLPDQHTALAAIAEITNYRLARTDDFIQLFELRS